MKNPENKNSKKEGIRVQLYVLLFGIAIVVACIFLKWLFKV
jgi:hypothetical protein